MRKDRFFVQIDRKNELLKMVAWGEGAAPREIEMRLSLGPGYYCHVDPEKKSHYNGCPECTNNKFAGLQIRDTIYSYITVHWIHITGASEISKDRLEGARSRLYRRRFLQRNTHLKFSAFFEIYGIDTPLHRSRLFSFRLMFLAELQWNFWIFGSISICWDWKHNNNHFSSNVQRKLAGILLDKML